MKWDVKHDRAKRVIDAFLENTSRWTEREDLTEGLTTEEQAIVSEEISVMIGSISKRYKLKERLTENKLKSEKEVNSTPQTKETKPEPVSEVKTDSSPKRVRKTTSEKKVTARKPRTKKEKAVNQKESV